MKFKKIVLITLLLLAILSVNSVSATDNNATTDVVAANDNITDEIDKVDENNVNEIVNVDNVCEEINANENYNNLYCNAEEDKLAIYLDGIRIDLWTNDYYYQYTGKGYDISTYIDDITYRDNANYYLNLLIYNKNNNLVFNSTKEVKKSYYYSDGTKFNVNLAGGSYTTVLTATMISGQRIYKSESFKYNIYLESKEEYEKYLYEDIEDESGEKIKIYASKVKVKVKAKKYFKVTLKYKNGRPIKHAWVTLRIWTGKKAKNYDFKTNSKGIIKFNTKKLKIGTHKVKISYEDWITCPGYYGVKYSKIIVKKTIKTVKKTTTKKKKSKYKTITIKIKSPKSYFATKKLKTGDKLQTVYSKGGQYNKGVYAEIIDYDYPIHTKLKKAKFYFKNNGIIKTKTVTKITNNKYYSGAKTKLINGYTPYKAKVWYK